MNTIGSNHSSVSSKVFWPSHIRASTCKSGYLIGWNIRSFITCVATVITEAKLVDVESCLADIAQSKETWVSAMHKACAVTPVILGVWIADADDVEAFLSRWDDSDDVARRKQTADIWLNVEFNSETNLPVLRSVYSCGYKYLSVSTEFSVYSQPNPNRQQSLSLFPVSLDMSPYVSFTASASASPSPNLSRVPSPAPAAAAATAPKEDPLQRRVGLHTAFTNSHGNSHTSPTLNEMENILGQINHSYRLERYLLTRFPYANAEKKSLSLPFRRPIARVIQGIWPSVVYPLLWLFFGLRVAAEVILGVLDFRLPRWFLSGVTLKDFSTTALQVHLRLQQWCFWPWQYTVLRRRDPWHPEITRIQYMNFLNSMWLVVNDIIIGVFFAYILRSNADAIADFMRARVQDETIDHVDLMVRWLMGWPSGIKLNNNLDEFFGNMCLTFMAIWKIPHAFILDRLPTIISLIGLSGVGGATLLISLLADLILLLGMHLWLSYSVFAALYNWQLSNLISLYHLFRMQKQNVLRHRVDTCEYDLQQLLLGTVLFTVLLFLLPTTLAYYILFAGMRVKALVFQIVFEAFLAFLNHFPLFTLSVSLRDPTRLPGGIFFELMKPQASPAASHYGSSSNGHQKRRHHKAVSIGSWPSSSLSSGSLAAEQTVYLTMKTRHLSLDRVFFQFSLLSQRLSQHFKPAYVIECLLRGRSVEPVAKLQYPLVPDSRPSLDSFWRFLKESLLESSEPVK